MPKTPPKPSRKPAHPPAPKSKNSAPTPARPASSPPLPLSPSPTLPASGPTRIERDSMGEMPVPASALYGASTQRAVLNFPISGRRVPDQIVKAYALLKSACAQTNLKLHRLDPARTQRIVEACHEISDGLTAFGGLAQGGHFPIDIFQTGSGTSTNMNVNEVIANIVCIRLHKPIGSSKDPAYLTDLAAQGAVHPNDHVNLGQSSNDTFPTAMHLAAAIEIHNNLLPAVKRIADRLDALAAEFDKIVKIGRTHLQDATPIRLGQEFSGFASQMHHAEERLHRALHTLGELPIGGTAVGTGINTHEQFGALVAAILTEQTNIHFREAANHFEAQHAKDAIVEASGHLRTIAVSLTKIAGDIRLMGMGPRCGLGELILPAVQPGSSIMPGKVNPVICEAVIMAACQVIGNDLALGLGGLGGVGSLLDLNVAMPMMAANILDSAHLLTRSCHVFTDKLLEGLKPDEQRCQSLIEGSLAMCTTLVPVIGYDKSAALAKEAFKQGKTVRQLAQETLVGQKDLAGKPISAKDIDAYLEPWSMTLPGGEGAAGG